MFLQLFIILLVLIIFITKSHLETKPPLTPPGLIGLPIIGVSIFATRLENLIKKCREKFGDIFWLRLGSRNIVFICEFELIKEAFNNPKLQGRPTNSHTAVKFFGDGVVNTEGNVWKDNRRFSLRTLKDGGMGKSSLDDIVSFETKELISSFEKKTGYSTKIPESIDVATANVIWQILAGDRYDMEDGRIHRMQSAIVDAFNACQTRLFPVDMMPWIVPYIPTIVMKKYLKEIDIDNCIMRVGKMEMAAIKNHLNTENERSHQDFIDAYLLNVEKEKSKNIENNSFTMKQLIGTVGDLFTAGSESTSTSIRWFLLLMARYPEVQRKVQMEIDSVVPKDRFPNTSDKLNLPYLDAAIYEMMRLKGPAIFSLIHVASEDTRIRKYYIPKGTYVYGYFKGCHRSPQLWKHPNDYYPEHFLGDDGKIKQNINGFVPFSIGKRSCIGEGLAKMSIFLLSAALLQKFELSMSEEQRISFDSIVDKPIFNGVNPIKICIYNREAN